MKPTSRHHNLTLTLPPLSKSPNYSFTNGWRPQMLSLPSNIYSPPACCPPYAIAYVFFEILVCWSLYDSTGPDSTCCSMCSKFFLSTDTGDRPYKCQYCGDQFARRYVSPVVKWQPLTSSSDLLSRHVNKCHANEKPPPSSGSSRRKGAASATRATTSKQACDQCVQSSLPCDGCNPCGKHQ
jgi:hypothetical protein